VLGRVDFGASYTDEDTMVDETEARNFRTPYSPMYEPPPVKRQCPSICAWPDNHANGPMLSSSESLHILAGNAP
jgi:hypothetical protein